ncbi:glycosyltransferase family 69 protein [Periconia macrospinosa]|uniref:Glycosyltransferase family 69 protein n=1 Tax=Periconia macrospinosa TaxID=97972 RepID=A0A2V1DZ60_9PLEO|nr:glycosyltransferase family 69 protein [Periconia macrospinosa]
MLLKPQSLSRVLRKPIFRLLVVFLFALDLLHICNIHSHHVAVHDGPPPPRNTKRIFIAANHWNSAPLLRSHWNAALLALVKELGIGNVYVSIYESGSWDDTKDVLRELDAALGELGVDREITMEEVSHADEISRKTRGEGWIEVPGSEGEMALRRIPFLARQRNRLVEALRKVSREKGGSFDTVLFLNDVVFTPQDVLTLLNTNNGSYSAACSLDFAQFPLFYDTFALRDSEGHQAVMQTWPYFRSSASRHAAQRLQPVPVTSCWNGMVAMPAAPFLAPNFLSFRGISDSLGAYHLEASECCLIHADNYWVGYNGSAFDDIHANNGGMSMGEMFKGVWVNRFLRWVLAARTLGEERTVWKRVQEWRRTHQGEWEPGSFCMVNEMQVIHAAGWRHV